MKILENSCVLSESHFSYFLFFCSFLSCFCVRKKKIIDEVVLYFAFLQENLCTITIDKYKNIIRHCLMNTQIVKKDFLRNYSTISV